MEPERRSSLTDEELKQAGTTGQAWLSNSERIGFNLPNQAMPTNGLATTLPTYELLRDAELSHCGQKFYVIEEVRRENKGGREVLCATVGVLYITNSPEHWHEETCELYFVLEAKTGSQMIVGNECVDLTPGMVILLPPGAENKHGAFGELQALMLFTPGLAKAEFNEQRDAGNTGKMAQASAVGLPKRSINTIEGDTTTGGAVIAQIPSQFLGEPAQKSTGDETPFTKSIPGISVAALTVRGDAPTYSHENPGVTKIYTILGGEGHVLLGDEAVNVKKGNIVLVPPGMENALVARNGGAVNSLVAFLSEDRNVSASNLEQTRHKQTKMRLVDLFKV